MSEKDKIRVLEKLAFDPKKYRDQQLLTFIRQGRYHYELCNHENSKIRTEVARRCDISLFSSMIKKDQIYDVLKVICKRGTEEQLTKILELRLDCDVQVLSRGFPSHINRILELGASSDAAMQIAKTTDDPEHLSALLDHTDWTVREIIAKRGSKEHLDHLLSDDCALVRCAVALRGFKDHLDVLQYDEDNFFTEYCHLRTTQNQQANTMQHHMMSHMSMDELVDYECKGHPQRYTCPSEIANKMLEELATKQPKQKNASVNTDINAGEKKKVPWILTKKGGLVAYTTVILILLSPFIYHFLF